MKSNEDDLFCQVLDEMRERIGSAAEVGNDFLKKMMGQGVTLYKQRAEQAEVEIDLDDIKYMEAGVAFAVACRTKRHQPPIPEWHQQIIADLGKGKKGS